MTIKIEDNIDDLTAISAVKRVVERGKVSRFGNYCFVTIHKVANEEIVVETRRYRKTPCFRVYKNVL